MRSTPQTVPGIIREVKKRWFMKAAWQGLILTALFLIACISVLLLSVFTWNAAPLFQSILVVVFVLAWLGALGWLIIRPLLREVSEARIAMYIEEKFPELEDRLNSAVEIKNEISYFDRDSLIHRVMDDALGKLQTIQLSSIIDINKQRLLLFGTLALLALFLFAGLNMKEDLSGVTSQIDISLNPKDHFQQEILMITPGDIQIEKGESIDVTAELKAETAGDGMLHFTIADDTWQKELMDKGPDQRNFISRMTDVQQSMSYYIELDGLRSPEFRITIYEFPKVTQIDLKYSYPGYTALPTRFEENTGNIRGLEGSTVTISVETSGNAVEGDIVIKDSTNIKLSALGNGKFSGDLVISKPAVYFIQLTDDQGKQNKFPVEYQISPVKDQLPLISITDPKRDVRVNAIEEVIIFAIISDDFGLKTAALKFSVNGEEEQQINLKKSGGKTLKEISASEVFYLEDYALEPGDVISYYFEASDYLEREAPSLSQMYFIEVIPFDANYTQVNNQGGGAGMPAGSQQVLNQQMIINATWNLLRKRHDVSGSEFDENANTIEQSQRGLKGTIEQMATQAELSAQAGGDQDLQKMLDLLKLAIEQMQAAAEKLADKDLQAALIPERKALNFLLKAEAQNKDKMVQMSQNQNSAAGGGMSEDRLTELMELQLDADKNKYETQQQRASAQDQEIDKVLQKLQELANKTQSLTRQQQENAMQETKDRRELDRLTRDQEQLRQEAEDLASRLREMSRDNEQISRQVQERIDRIADMMKEAEQELKEENYQEYAAKQNRALQELDALQQRLRSSLADNTREMLEDFSRNFNDMKDREEKLADDIRKSAKNETDRWGQLDDPEKKKELVDAREKLIEDLQQLQEQAAEIEKQSEQENPQIATALRNLQKSIKREKLEGHMSDSRKLLNRGWLDYARRLEEEIEFTMESLDGEVRELNAGLPKTDEERLSESLEETRELMERFKDALSQSDSPENNQQQANAESPQQGEAAPQQSQLNREDLARMNRLREQGKQMMERLQGDFNNDSGMLEKLTNAGEPFNQSFQGTLIAENADEYFDENVYQPLSQLETYILKRLDEIEMQKKLYGMRKEDIPREYKKMVDKYFEAIAK